MEDCPDRIFIEASGFGKLSDVVKVCIQLKEKEHLEMMIGPNVTVVDIGMVEAYASGLGEFYVDQIEHADVILVNNIDSDDVESEEIEEGWKALEQLNTKALKSEDAREVLKSVMESGNVDQNLQIEGDTLIKYLGADAFVEVPDGIRIIADSAFEYCMEVQEVHLPDSVERIGKACLSGEWNQKDTFTGKHKNNRHLCFQRNTSGIYRITGEFAETWAQCIPLLQDVKKAKFPEHLVEIPHDTLMIVETAGSNTAA